MAKSLESLELEIRELDAPGQEKILRMLVETLDGAAEPDVETVWLEEAERRSLEIESGQVVCIPADEVFRKLGAQFKK